MAENSNESRVDEVNMKDGFGHNRYQYGNIPSETK